MSTDRPVLEKEITPKMIEAGVNALLKWIPDAEYISEREAVKEIFLAMQAQDTQTQIAPAQDTDQTAHRLSP